MKPPINLMTTINIRISERDRAKLKALAAKEHITLPQLATRAVEEYLAPSGMWVVSIRQSNATNTLHNQPEADESGDKISQCPTCYCMTKTIDGACGKCGAQKFGDASESVCPRCINGKLKEITNSGRIKLVKCDVCSGTGKVAKGDV